MFVEKLLTLRKGGVGIFVSSMGGKYALPCMNGIATHSIYAMHDKTLHTWEHDSSYWENEKAALLGK